LALLFSASGTIDFIEFLTVVKTTPPNENEDIELRGAISCFDYNSDGLISADEIRHLMTSTGEKVTDEDVDKMLEDCQIDGDGMISYESEYPEIQSSWPPPLQK
jgi:Ca2+-binding EF-hand superfamily protein